MNSPDMKKDAEELARTIKKLEGRTDYALELVGVVAPMLSEAEGQALYAFAVRTTRLLAPIGGSK